MLCYANDLYREGAIVHTHTRNLSFVRMYYVFKKMGIKNNKFHLALLDKDLMNVDPHDENNSDEIKAKIIIECRRNPWYYFREMIRMSGSGASMLFKANRASLAMIWLALQNINQTVILPRQKGKTLTTIAIDSYLMFIRNYNTKIAMLTKDDVLRVENVQRLITIRDALPAWFINKQPGDKTNSDSISYTLLKNTYQTFINKGNQIDADKLGKGMSPARQHWDELAFFRFNYISFPAALFSMNAAVKQAQENKQIHGITITTTPGLLSTKEGQYVYKNFVCDALPFTEHLYDLENLEELVRVIDKNSMKGFVLIEFNPFQLGDTLENVRQQIRIVADEEGSESIKRDFFNIWLHGGKDSSILSDKAIERLKSYIAEYQWAQFDDGYYIYWFLPETVVKSAAFKTIPTVLSMDGSENIGKDYTAFFIQDARNMEVIGRISVNETNNTALAMFIAKLLIEHPNMLFIPESNSTGRTCVDTILLEFQKRRINPFLRIWNTYVEDEINDISEVRSYSNIEPIINSKRKCFGFRTGSTSRDFLYKNTFKRAIEHNFDKMRDSMLINEMINLKMKNGRIDHETKGHDDHVVSYLLGCYPLFFSSKLDIYFSHHTLAFEPLCDYVESGRSVDEENEKDIKAFDSIMNEINRLQSEFEQTTFEMKKAQILHEIRMHQSMLPDFVKSRKTDMSTVKKVQENDMTVADLNMSSHQDTMSYMESMKDLILI